MKINQKQENMNPEDASPNAGGISNISFAPLQAGIYPAIVEKVDEGTYRAKYSTFQSDAKDNLWTYVKIRPSVVALSTTPQIAENEDGEMVEFEKPVRTLINRQDFTVGVRNSAGTAFIRPDGDSSKDAIFRSSTGAFFFLKEAGCYETDLDGEVSLNFDMERINNRVMFVGVKPAAYNKETKQNWNAEQFEQWVKDNVIPEGDEASIEEILEAVDAYNEGEGYGEGEGMRVKNVITYWGSLSPKQAEDMGFFHDKETHLTFVSEEDYEAYIAMGELEDNSF